MIELPITKEQVERAEVLYEFKILNNSVEKGEGNIFGALGEIVVQDYYKDIVDSTKSCKDYDLIIRKIKIDVKTKMTNVPPLPHYYCSVYAYNIEQQCDRYMFVRATSKMDKAWIMGHIDKAEFYTKARFFRKGDTDPTFPSFKFKGDNFSLPISELTFKQR